MTYWAWAQSTYTMPPEEKAAYRLVALEQYERLRKSTLGTQYEHFIALPCEMHGTAYIELALALESIAQAWEQFEATKAAAKGVRDALRMVREREVVYRYIEDAENMELR